MTDYTKYFRPRLPGDLLDVAPLIHLGLQGDTTEGLIAYEGRFIDRGQLRAHVAQICQWLWLKGLRKGEHVAVMLSNSAEYIALIYALIISGLVWIPVNTKLRGASLKYILDHSMPRLLISEPEFGEALAVLERESTMVANVAEIAMTRLGAPEVDHVPLHHSDTLCVIYTSGTTGVPKGVVFTHRMLRIASEAAIMVAAIKPGDRVFLWEPLCHIGGAQMLMLPFLEKAALFVVKRFSARNFWQQWTAANATHLHYLGGILDILMQLPASAKPEGATVRVAWGAGISAVSWNTIRDRLRCEIRECYGMTECSSFAMVNAAGKPGSIGRALPWIHIALVGEDGKFVERGGIGEIVLSSDLAGVFLPGYLCNDEATRRTIRGGKLYTGDMARQDADGDYAFVGRRTDSMRVRGENVSAWEVERVFAEHHAIQASAAIGVASEVGEQEILLYVQFKPHGNIDWSDLVAWATPRLASFQLPRFFQAVERFDLTPSERIQKHRLARDVDSAWDRVASSP